MSDVPRMVSREIRFLSQHYPKRQLLVWYSAKVRRLQYHLMVKQPGEAGYDIELAAYPGYVAIKR